jgi:hypothetical protein
MPEEIVTLIELTPTALLGVIADAFNQLVELGEKVDVRFGSVMTNYGYVLQDREGIWEAKLKVGEAPSWWDGASSIDDDDD